MMPIVADDIRRALLEMMGEASRNDGGFARVFVLEQAAFKLGARYDHNAHRAILDVFDDLYRSGIVSYGLNLEASSNSGHNWCHLTDHGKASLRELSRDPVNPAGYRTAIKPYVDDLPIVVSYLEEALETFNSRSVKAAAVMLGAAAEALNLTIRDAIKARCASTGRTARKALDDFRIAEVLRGIEAELEPRVKEMPVDLRERFESYWPAWTGLYRMTRNAAGHPASLAPVTREAVHAALLLFHEQARLCRELEAWVRAAL